MEEPSCKGGLGHPNLIWRMEQKRSPSTDWLPIIATHHSSPDAPENVTFLLMPNSLRAEQTEEDKEAQDQNQQCGESEELVCNLLCSSSSSSYSLQSKNNDTMFFVTA